MLVTPDQEIGGFPRKLRRARNENRMKTKYIPPEIGMPDLTNAPRKR